MATETVQQASRQRSVRIPETRHFKIEDGLPLRIPGKPPESIPTVSDPSNPNPVTKNPSIPMSEKSNILTKEWKAHLLAQADKLVANADPKPFRHSQVDGFLPADLLPLVYQEFPEFNWEQWFVYSNKLEDKKALNDWNKFPKYTYALLNFLNSHEFVSRFRGFSNCDLTSDPGLHGGGWHIHASGGSLNPHLDYSIHPKIGMQRKLNLIIYLCQDWQPSWGGHFGLWNVDPKTGRAGELAKECPVGMNRALIFDTTQNSWHGLSRTVACPETHARKSLAVYYLCEAPEDADPRGRALYAPTESQKGDPEIEELILKRSRVETSSTVYRA